MKVIKPSIDHLSQIIGLWEKQYIYHHDLDSDYYVSNSPKLVKQFEEYLKKAIERDDPYILCAFVNDKMVGFITFEKAKADYFDTNITEYGEVIELYVDEDSRTQGVGKALMEAVEKHFADQGLEWIELQASTFNDLALNFYKGSGYTNRQTLMFKNISEK